MEENVKQAIENYQCPGCVSGYNTECFQPHHSGVGCGGHTAGTMAQNIGPFFLGMPKGFNRLGEQTSLKPIIFNNFSEVEGGKLFGRMNSNNNWHLIWWYLDGRHFTSLNSSLIPRKSPEIIALKKRKAELQSELTEIENKLNEK